MREMISIECLLYVGNETLKQKTGRFLEKIVGNLFLKK